MVRDRHVGVWNLVGAIGFTLCGALGYASFASSGVSTCFLSVTFIPNSVLFVPGQVNYQSVLSTFWGSWAFLIGSVMQLWESLWREDPKSA